MKKAIIGILVIVLLAMLSLVLASFIVIGDKVSATRSIYINAPPQSTYEHVANLRSWEKWSPWSKMDPDMKVEYQNGGVGEGASYTFKSEMKNLGSGKLTITDVHKNKSISTLVEMNENSGEGYWDFSQKDKGTNATWTFSYEPKNIVERVMGLFFNSMMGLSLEDGLEGLKEYSEKAPPPSFNVQSSLKKKMQEVRDSILNARKNK